MLHLTTGEPDMPYRDLEAQLLYGTASDTDSDSEVGLDAGTKYIMRALLTK